MGNERPDRQAGVTPAADADDLAWYGHPSVPPEFAPDVTPAPAATDLDLSAEVRRYQRILVLAVAAGGALLVLSSPGLRRFLRSAARMAARTGVPALVAREVAQALKRGGGAAAHES